LRERERRHRTVKLFGLLAPLGLLVLLAILSSLLVRSSLQETEKQATAQALKGCETPARVLTNALKRQTSQRIDLLEKVAGIEAFRQALPTKRIDEPLSDSDEHRAKLETWLRDFVKREKIDTRHFFSNILVADRRGWIIADSAGHTELYGTRWDYRD